MGVSSHLRSPSLERGLSLGQQRQERTSKLNDSTPEHLLEELEAKRKAKAAEWAAFKASGNSAIVLKIQTFVSVFQQCV